MTTPAPADPTVAPRTRLIRTPNERVFLHVLVNTAAANITTSYLWFALTFWVYLVTLLVPEERHANANGLVGTVQGIAFIITSVFSGLSVGPLGMGWTLLIAIVATAIAGVHLLLLRIPEEQPAASVGRGVDLRGAITAVRLAPGLFALIIFSTFNNLIGGVYIALMDPYGLTLFSVEAWGTVFGVAATGFIVGGVLIARFGLGRNPIRTMLLVVAGMGLLGALFTIRDWWLLYAVGIWLYMASWGRGGARHRARVRLRGACHGRHRPARIRDAVVPAHHRAIPDRARDAVADRVRDRDRADACAVGGRPGAHTSSD